MIRGEETQELKNGGLDGSWVTALSSVGAPGWTGQGADGRTGGRSGAGAGADWADGQGVERK